MLANTGDARIDPDPDPDPDPDLDTIPNPDPDADPNPEDITAFAKVSRILRAPTKRPTPTMNTSKNDNSNVLITV